MATAKQIEANRRNAQKSIGPKTDEGKARVKFNALRHGVRAETLALPHEDDAEVQGFVDEVIAAIAPRDAMEAELAAEIATLSWKLRRAERVEQAALAKRMIKLERTIHETEEECARWELELLAYDDDPAGQRRRRYVSGIRNALARARKELVKWREMHPEEVDSGPQVEPEVVEEQDVPAEIGSVRQTPDSTPPPCFETPRPARAVTPVPVAKTSVNPLALAPVLV